ncbi:MAG: tRNA (adenosine(37)-N6)-dimethylallyltransferase MiaA [Bacteroidales bacterium]|nr:tRNA (adenosine(37)-N6)-dimethylallyltransferase MiaA [Bacteroidales bacterium]
MNAVRKKLIILTGPTAVGKTKYAISLAKQFDTDIVSCDSRQFYKEMSIGTAVPSLEELAAVKHHLIHHKSVVDYYNVSMFEQDALKILNVLFKTKDVVVMTGGSGLYIDVIANGIAELPDADLALREQLKFECEEKGLLFMVQKLKLLDEEYYNTVDLSNKNRVLRALEVCIQTGQKFSQLRNNSKVIRPFNIQKICLMRDRAELYDRINKRVDSMIQLGLLDEVQSLLPMRDFQSLNTVGYKELFDFFDGNVTLEKAIENIKTNSRRYAKRQITWFKRDLLYEYCFLNDDLLIR